MPENRDLHERTFAFAAHTRSLVRALPRTISNIEDAKQLIRSSGSVGANYIESNEGLGKKDFVMHLKIARKEAKESMYWLRLLDTAENKELESKRTLLVTEAKELLLIFSSIINKFLS